MAFFYSAMPTRVGLVHNFTLGSVMTFLYLYDGSLALGSKWCSYCLIYSVAYLSSPYWVAEGFDEESKSNPAVKSDITSINNSVDNVSSGKRKAA